MANAFLDILDPVGQGLQMSEGRLQRAILKISTPTPIGCGLTPSSDHAAAAWWASVQSSLCEDRDLFGLRASLTRHADAAWTFLSSALSLKGAADASKVSHFLATSSRELLDGTVYHPGADREQRVVRLAMRLISRSRAQAFAAATSTTSISPHFTAADYILSKSPTSIGNIYATPLSPRCPEPLTPVNYIHFTRYFLGLPPLHTIGNINPDSPADYPAQRCLVHRGAILDAAACHASACTSSASSRTKKHNHLVRVVAEKAREAGLLAEPEPPSHTLLRGEFTPEQCRTLFPTKTGALYKEAFHKLMTALGDHHDPQHHEGHIKRMAAAVPPVPCADLKGLRIDLSLQDPVDGDERWIDATVVNTAAPSYRTMELAFTAAHLEAEAIANGTPPSSRVESPALAGREKAKRFKYSCLITLSQRQVPRLRHRPPIFTPMAASCIGDLATGTMEVIEWITSKYLRLCQTLGHRDDGFTPKQLTHIFKRHFFHSVHCALAAGMGNMIAYAGTPAAARLF